MSGADQTFCPLPWLYQSIKNNGEIRVCPPAHVSPTKGILRKEDGTVYNAAADSLAESRNSPLLKQMRRQMLAGEWPETCVRCQTEEKAGARSRRIYDGANLKQYIDYEKAVNLTDKDGSIDNEGLPPMMYDIRFGNRCNLRCRTCGPTESDAWYTEHQKLYGDSFNDNGVTVKLEAKDGKLIANNTYTWYESESFLRQFEKNIRHVRLLHTVGGEPLLIDQQYRILEKCIAEGVAGNIAIEYNSNITVIPEKIWALWKEFRLVKIGASIDGIGEKNDYVRHPSKWSVIEKNISRLESAPGNFELWFAVTVHAYSMFYLPEIIEWRLKQNFHRFNNNLDVPFVTNHLLHNPAFLNIRILPQAVKQRIVEKFHDFERWFQNWNQSNTFIPGAKAEYLQDKLHTLLQSQLEYMNSEDWSHLLPKFWRYTQNMDNFHKRDFATVFPELFKLLQSHLKN